MKPYINKFRSTKFAIAKLFVGLILEKDMYKFDEGIIGVICQPALCNTCLFGGGLCIKHIIPTMLADWKIARHNHQRE